MFKVRRKRQTIVSYLREKFGGSWDYVSGLHCWHADDGRVVRKTYSVDEFDNVTNVRYYMYHPDKSPELVML